MYRNMINIYQPNEIDCHVPFRAVVTCSSHYNQVRFATLVQDMKWDEVRLIKTPSELPHVDSFDRRKRTLIIFDNCYEMPTKHDMMVMFDFTIRGRLNGISVLFMEDSLMNIPRDVRRNMDVLFITTDASHWVWKAIENEFLIGVTICRTCPPYLVKINTRSFEYTRCNIVLTE